MKKLLLPFLLLLGACATSSAGDKPVGKITLSRSVWSHYQEYLHAIGTNQPGAFAVSTDGQDSYYIWCEAILCTGGPTYKRDAVQGCQRYNSKCVPFAFRDDILIEYQIEE